MAINAVFPNIDEAGLALREARERLDSAEGEIVLDFSSVRRIEAATLKEIEELVSVADGKVRVVLRGVNIDVYKVLKLVNLTRRVSFVN